MAAIPPREQSERSNDGASFSGVVISSQMKRVTKLALN
jgi:hypothetical protein